MFRQGSLERRQAQSEKSKNLKIKIPKKKQHPKKFSFRTPASLSTRFRAFHHTPFEVRRFSRRFHLIAIFTHVEKLY